MKDSARKLTPKEEARKIKFEALKESLQKEGYEAKNLTISIVQANVQGVLTALPFVIILAVLYIGYGGASSLKNDLFTSFLALVLMLGLFVAHELIHGFVWGMFAKNHFKSIEFGVIWKMLTPYCTCAEPLKKGQYIIGALMPTIILGFGLGAVAVVSSSFMLFLLAGVMIFGGSGDFLIVLKLLFYRTEKKEILYCDHPYECGLAVFEK